MGLAAVRVTISGLPAQPVHRQSYQKHANHRDHGSEPTDESTRAEQAGDTEKAREGRDATKAEDLRERSRMVGFTFPPPCQSTQGHSSGQVSLTTASQIAARLFAASAADSEISMGFHTGSPRPALACSSQMF